MKKAPVKRMHISEAELKQLLKLKLPQNDPLKELARRTFIFSCFTGLAYVDTQLLYPHHIGKAAEGRRYIRINRRKTNVDLRPLQKPFYTQKILLIINELYL